MDHQDDRLGEALRRLIEVAAQDEQGRSALMELAEAITELVEAAMPPLPPSLIEEPDTSVVPIDQEELATLVKTVGSPDDGAAPSPLAEAFRAAAAVPGAATSPAAGEIVLPPSYRDLAVPEAELRDERRAERDARLPALAERARVKAELTRSLAQDAAVGRPPDVGLLHRARSMGASTWMADLRDPDPTALTELADCFAALADLADYIALLPAPHGATNERFAAALQTMAPILSAHRTSALHFRHTPDEDQQAGFDWLRATASDERIFVARHMRIDDPFDPAAIASAMGPIRMELEGMHAGEERRELRRRALGQARYHAGLLVDGHGTDHDRAKVVEAIEKAVDDGVPPSSLDLRNLLLPVRAVLPPADDPRSGYGRVITELDSHLAREAAALDDSGDDDVDAPHSAEVAEVAELLAGTSVVLIGGARRVEAEAAIRGAFALREVVWMAIDDDPTPAQLERVIRRDDVSVVFLLVRWARHAYTDASSSADRYDKPFVRVEGGYNPNGLAHDVLEQASERLRRARGDRTDDER